jgi:cytochrome P450
MSNIQRQKFLVLTRRSLTANIVPKMMWVMLEIHKDQSLRLKIRSELKENNLLGDLGVDDVKTILALPRLQSVYAEALRMYDQVMLPRETTKEVQVNGGKFPKKGTIVICSYEAHTDAQAWNTGINNEHSTNSFWAERFLFHPGDPNSGPIVRNAILPAARLSDSQLRDLERNSDGPVFPDKTTAGHYIPFGGGARICPGSHFAKRSIMTAVVMMTAMVDLEIMASKDQLRMDERGFGLGGQHPIGKVPFRMRKWQENHV